MTKPTKKQIEEYLIGYTDADTALEAMLVLGDRLSVCYSIAYDDDKMVGRDLHLRWGVWFSEPAIYTLVADDGTLSASFSLHAVYKMVHNPLILMRRSGLFQNDPDKARARLDLLPWICVDLWDTLVEESRNEA